MISYTESNPIYVQPGEKIHFKESDDYVILKHLCRTITDELNRGRPLDHNLVNRLIQYISKLIKKDGQLIDPPDDFYYLLNMLNVYTTKHIDDPDFQLGALKGAFDIYKKCSKEILDKEH